MADEIIFVCHLTPPRLEDGNLPNAPVRGQVTGRPSLGGFTHLLQPEIGDAVDLPRTTDLKALLDHHEVHAHVDPCLHLGHSGQRHIRRHLKQGEVGVVDDDGVAPRAQSYPRLVLTQAVAVVELGRIELVFSRHFVHHPVVCRADHSPFRLGEAASVR